jgi:ubiquilin
LLGGTQTNSTARPNPAGRASGLGGLGLGGLGLPGMDNLFNSMPDSNQMTQLLQNPAVSQMMQSLLSNPEYMNQVLLLSKGF